MRGGHRHHAFHHGHHRRFGWSPSARLAWFIRGKLHRRLFVWFGATILVTGLAVVAVTSTFNRGGLGVPDAMRGLGHLFVGDISERWDAPVERDAWLEDLTRSLRLAVVLDDPGRRTQQTFGTPRGRALYTAPIVRRGARLGQVTVYADPSRAGHGAQVALALFAAFLVLWNASGRLARHLMRPYAELTRIAEDLGHGQLSSRVELHPHQSRETRVLAESLNSMAERIEKQLSNQKELLAAVSHELRTPLSRIRLLVEIARSRGLEEETALELDQEAVEMDFLVGELLASARLDFSAMALRPVNARDLGERALERAGVEPARLSVPDEALDFDADPTLISRALANLLENARRHGGGVERLVISRMEGFVRLLVEDQGPGIIRGDEEKIFQAFYRSAVRSTEGDAENERGSLGLGLALVRRIAEAHGGSAFARNGPAGGAQVGIELPLRAGNAPRDGF